MQNNRYQNSYIKGLKRNVINNTIAGIVIAGIIFIIQLIGGCEQPEITHRKTLIDSLQINTNDEINDWEQTPPSTIQPLNQLNKTFFLLNNQPISLLSRYFCVSLSYYKTRRYDI